MSGPVDYSIGPDSFFKEGLQLGVHKHEAMGIPISKGGVQLNTQEQLEHAQKYSGIFPKSFKLIKKQDGFADYWKSSCFLVFISRHFSTGIK